MMQWIDYAYGEVILESPVLEALIASAPIQRLKGIAQVGVSSPIPGRRSFTRFEHSVGVMTLLRRFGASEAEQIAGLLHDVSHTAFSHTIDWVLGSASKEDFQDSQYERILLRSEIPALLKEYGYDIESFRDLDQFTLLEQPSPHLCADRMDYSFRESSKEVIAACLPKIVVHNGMFAYKTVEAAEVHANAFLLLQSKMGGFETTARSELFGRLLKYAIEKGVIVFDDVWGTDQEVTEKLRASEDKHVQTLLEWFERDSWEEMPSSGEVAHPKFRFIDPDVAMEGETKPLSTLSTTFAPTLAAAREESKQGIRTIAYSFDVL